MRDYYNLTQCLCMSLEFKNKGKKSHLVLNQFTIKKKTRVRTLVHSVSMCIWIYHQNFVSLSSNTYKLPCMCLT